MKLPKKYLSYSAWSLWKKDKEKYRKRYYENEPSFETRETVFGKHISQLLEKNEKHPILAKVPRGEFPEYRISTEINGVPIFSVLDSFSPSVGSIFEFKTGKVIWNQERVNNHDQLPFYACAVKSHIGFFDPHVLLCWLETRLAEKKETIGGIDFVTDDTRDMAIELTGKIEVFTRIITPEDVENISNDIKKVADEISEDYTGYLKKLDLNV